MAEHKDDESTFHYGSKNSDRPGAFGSRRDELYAALDEAYGPGNWQFGWRLNGRLCSFDEVFWNIYVGGYANYFDAHHDEAEYLAANFSYAYDLDPISWHQAYDSHALLNIPGRPNQFHHVALNFAVAMATGGWRGSRPIQVRGPGTEGERWNPGHIPAPTEYASQNKPSVKGWWSPNSIEAVYQQSKVLCVWRMSASHDELLE